MKRASFAAVLLVALVPLLAGCGGDGSTGTSVPEGTMDLNFTGDSTFRGPHGGDSLHAAVVHDGTGSVVGAQKTVVSSSLTLAFAIQFSNALAEGESYHLDYWIDSNFNGGIEGECDPPEHDHQWRIDIPTVTDPVTINDTHRPTETEPVCSTFGGSDSDGGGGGGY